MVQLIAIPAVVALIGLFEVSAVRFGVDSRKTGDWRGPRA